MNLQLNTELMLRFENKIQDVTNLFSESGFDVLDQHLGNNLSFDLFTHFRNRYISNYCYFILFVICIQNNNSS